MTLDELARLVETMRKCQRRYFNSRDNRDLCMAKDAERRVDEAVANVLKPAGLFDQKP